MSDQVKILVLEDDDLDQFIIRRGFRMRRIANPLIFVKDGFEGLAVLDRLYREDGGAFSVVVLCDINMPRMNGFEFIHAIKRVDRFKRIPVFVLTSSENQLDIDRAYEAGAVGYMIKQNAGDAFVDAVEMLGLWIKVSLLPGPGADGPEGTGEGAGS